MSATDANTTRPSIHYCMSLCTQALESWLLSSHYMFVLLFARFPVLRIRSRSATHPSVYSCQRAAFVLLQKNAFSFCTIFRCHSAKHLGSPCLVLKVLSCMVICRRFVAFFMFFCWTYTSDLWCKYMSYLQTSSASRSLPCSSDCLWTMCISWFQVVPMLYSL